MLLALSEDVPWFYAITVPLYVKLLVSVGGGFCLKAVPQIPRLVYSDSIQATTWCLSGSLANLLLAYNSKTNQKRTFWKSFLYENRLHSRFQFELFTEYILASGEPLYL